jgi:hypothetical protein
MPLRPGQLVTGRKTLSLQTGVSESKIERILKHLENGQKIEQQKFTKFRIITIRNNDFSGSDANSEQKFEQQIDNKCTTNVQQVNTYNNEKNEKNPPFPPKGGLGGVFFQGGLRNTAYRGSQSGPIAKPRGMVRCWRQEPNGASRRNAAPPIFPLAQRYL